MQVSIIHSASDVQSVDISGTHIKHILSMLKLHFGVELTDRLLRDQYRYVLIKNNDPDASVLLHPEVIGSSMDGYDALLIVRDIEGEIPAVAVAGALTAAGVAASATSVSVLVITALINVGLSLALNAVMSLLSPTPEFSSDPSQGQQKQSALFNGAPVVREQGGIVPLILGAPYCGGVLISSGVSSEDF